MKNKARWFNIVFSLTIALSLLGVQSQSIALAMPGADSPGEMTALQDACLDGGRGVMSRADSLTGFSQFVGTRAGEPIRLSAEMKNGSPAEVARAYLTRCGGLFGLRDSENDLRLVKEKVTADGQRTLVRFQQEYNGIPVVAGEVYVQFNNEMDILAVGGEVLPKLYVDTTPTIDAAEAREFALASVAKNYGYDAADLTATEPVLKIYDPVLLEPWDGPTSLAWEMEVSLANALHLRQYVLVNAHRGNVLVSFNKVDNALDLATYDNNGTSTLPPNPGSLVCDETDPECDDSLGIDDDAKGAHRGAKNTYDFYFNQHGRDSIDNSGMQLVSVVDWLESGFCPNAFWNGSQMVYCDTVAMADDVVAHELTHGVTEHESGLFYYYQSGAINEALSDIWGEFVDLTSTTGFDDDAPSVRWEMGEDATAFGGTIRNMSDPTLFGDPDKMSSLNYYTGGGDNGGVHSNSGIANKAAYLMTDGGTFNSITVTALGMSKVAAIFYEVQTNLLVSGSDYRDLHDALYQACQNLVGTTPPGAGSPISTSDCDDGVLAAVEAVEMDEEPTLGFNPDAPVCDADNAFDLLYDDVETSNYLFNLAGVNNTPNPTDYPHWYRVNGMYAASGLYSFYGDDFDYDGGSDTSDTFMVMRSGVYLPPSLPNAYLRFNHAYGFEDDAGVYYDGGVLEYSVNNGATWLDANALIDSPLYDYNGIISTDFDNPLGGRNAFVGDSHGYISSRLNLTPLLGQSVLFRWRMATDVVGFDWGWWVDDIQFYSCVPVVPSIQAQSFRSQSTYDGWVLESGETTNNGGTLNRTDRIIVGDDAMNRQYRSIISFDTSSLPDNAVIISVTLRLKSLSGFVGQNPFNFLGALTADVRRVKFGSGPGLQLTDFRSASHLDAVGSFNPTIVSGWRDAIVTSASPYINRLGTTQFRLRFTLDDNNDLGADYVRFYAGETYSKAPRLIVQYYIP